MTVICIKNTYSVGMALLTSTGITINKTYNVEEVSYAVNSPASFYLIKDDVGNFVNYSKDYFKVLDEYRDNKLTQLGI
jgi:hypothetical protein